MFLGEYFPEVKCFRTHFTKTWISAELVNALMLLAPLTTSHGLYYSNSYSIFLKFIEEETLPFSFFGILFHREQV